MTKKEKDDAKNGALVGLVGGALIGVPILGAAAGAIVGSQYNKKKKKDYNKTR